MTYDKKRDFTVNSECGYIDFQMQTNSSFSTSEMITLSDENAANFQPFLPLVIRRLLFAADSDFRFQHRVIKLSGYRCRCFLR